MNYYEELGLTSSSTREEIQRAYKHLARILHPDRYPDAKVRRVMEAQMKRLNMIHKTLTDAKRRAAYDRSLQPKALEPLVVVEDQVPAAAPRWKRPEPWVWGMALALAGVLLFGAFRENIGGSATVARAAGGQTVGTIGDLGRTESRNGVLTDPQTQRLAATVRQLRERIRQLEDAEARGGPVPVQAVSAPVPPAPVGEDPPIGSTADVAQTFADTPTTTPDVRSLALPPSGSRLTGRWLYVPPSRRITGKEMYAAEYIEAVIVEQAGQLHGRYRARYRVTDRAISPEVLFQFSGEPAREEVAANWMGEGGARGEVRLKLLSENQLEVAWIASDLGRRQGLGSGRAILVRRQSP